MLNPEQEKAVKAVEGRVLVLAGAGSGKTRVIAHRIAYLIDHLGKKPTSILGLTFTNKAAAEMRQRVEKLVGAAAKQVTLSTFHSFCMQVLRREIDKLGYTREFSLYDERDLRRLIGQMAREMLNHEGQLPSLEPTYAALSQASQKALRADEEDEEGNWHDAFSKDLYGRMQTTLRAYNAVSFDSLITLTIQLFEEHPSVLEQYQDRYRYLMIDEYQDTNPAQFRLAELLASKYNNLCVVGDDDQSIYGWRGADVKNILHFKADTVVKLEQNYRSTEGILEAANAVIRQNKNRHSKRLWSSQKVSAPIEVFHAPTDAEEAQAIVQRLLHFRETKDMRWRDMAILYRSNALSRPFELALLQASWQKNGSWVRGIPYEVFGGLEFSERSEIKDLFAYLRIIANPHDTEALLRIINVPRRGISDTALDEMAAYSRSSDSPLWNVLSDTAEGRRAAPTARAMKAVGAFIDLIEEARRRFKELPNNKMDRLAAPKPLESTISNGVVSQHTTPFAIVDSRELSRKPNDPFYCLAAPKEHLSESLVWLIERIDYKKAIEEEVKSEKMRLFKWENVQECVNALAQYENEEEEPSLQHFIANTMLIRDTPRREQRAGDDKVQLMTFHSAKGLEFPACFLVGLEDHILPHEKSMKDTGIEEERRLFYVGITRAERYLTLSMARSRLRMGKYVPTQPSRFLFEIPKHLIKVSSPKDLT